MLLNSDTVGAERFERETGWALKPEGACKGDVCVVLPAELQNAAASGDAIDARQLAAAMNLPVAEAPTHNLLAIGPESIGSRALTSASAPDLVLPDLHGNHFELSSLLGQKIVVYAWAPY